MRSSLLIAALATAACGRVRFDDLAGAGDAKLDGDALVARGDAPPVSSQVCRVTRTAVSGVAADADLAVATSPTGFVATWLDTNGGPLSAMPFDANQVATRSAAVLAGSDLGTVNSGIVDIGDLFGLIIEDQTTAYGFGLPYDLSGLVAGTPGAVTAKLRNPFPSDVAKDARAIVGADGTQIETAYVEDDDTLGPVGGFAVSSSVLELAGDDGPTDAHITWTQDAGGGTTSCYAADLLIDHGAPAPVEGSSQMVATDCHGVRNSTGPPGPDGMNIVWTTSTGVVQSLYIVSTGDMATTLSMQGRAPKIGYDGTTWWIAWLDGTGAGTLTVASLTTTGTLVSTGLPGWTPAGDEAFEIVRGTDAAYLVVLSADTITFLKLCAP